MKPLIDDSVDKLTLPPVPHTLDGLHTALFDEINAIRSGDVSVSHARIFSQLSKQVIGAYMIQLMSSGRTKEMKQLKRAENG